MAVDLGDPLLPNQGARVNRRNWQAQGAATLRRTATQDSAGWRDIHRWVTLVAVGIMAVVASLVIGLPSAPRVEAVSTGLHNNRLVSETSPVSWTPHVRDGYVQAIAEVGNTVVVGGNFSSVQNPSRTQTFTRNNIFAFEKGTGVISPTFVPTLNGEVFSIVPTGDGQTVWVAGGFSTLNGQSVGRIIKLNVNTGQRVTQFQSPSFDGRIHEVILRGDRLYVAGRFTTVNGQPHTLLAALNPTTGAVIPDVKIEFAQPRGNPNAFLTIQAADATPDGSRMVVIGNFALIGGQPRYQIGVLDLTTSPISVANWQTTEYNDACSSSFWTYMRDVEVAPDGDYFVVVTTGAFSGGYASRTLCDSAARWEFSSVGSGLLPTWVNYTGGDTLLSAAVSDAAVYVGGHQRWSNNPYCGDCVGRGAIDQLGLAALDTRSGGTLSWAPTRELGVGVYDFLATSDGLWVGSDTERIANSQFRGRRAFLPLTSGWDMPLDYTGTLPASVYSFGNDTGAQDQLVRREFDGSIVTSSQNISTTEQLRNIRGAFMVDGKLYTAWSVGTNRSFRVQTFDGQNFGPAQTIDVNRLDSNNTSQINATTPPNISNFLNFDVPNALGMFFDPVTSRLYFTSPQYTWSSGGTRTSPPNLAYRQFSTESNIVGAVRYETVGNMNGLNWSNVRSMFLVGSHLYIADTSGNLTRWEFDHWAGTPIAGTNVVVSGPTIDGQNWRARDAFVYVGEGETPPNIEPTAQASVDCAAGSCQFSGAGSFDPDGTIVMYRWDFGDDTDPVTTSEPTVSHQYLASGQYTVTLTVTDNADGTGTDVIAVNVTIPNVPPSAQVSADCTGLDCSFSADGSTDPDGSIVSYEWAFGDGATATGDTAQHTYEEPGQYVVILKVTDDDGAVAQAQTDVTVFDPNVIPTVSFGAVAAVNVNSNAPAVTIPASVQAGDVLVLIATLNTEAVNVTGPAGWVLLDSASNSTATVQTQAWTKVASAGDAGSSVALSLSGYAKTALQVVSYSNAAGVGQAAVAIDTVSSTQRTTPGVTVDVPGSVVISYWADKRSDTTGWNLPGAVTLRSQTIGSPSGLVAAALADSGGPVAPGAAGGYTATTQGSANRRGVLWTIVIEPQA